MYMDVIFIDIAPKKCGNLTYTQTTPDADPYCMRLTVEELEELIKQVDRFYSCSQLGDLDKTQKIRNAEERVKELLRIVK